jgi:hypothetical protein
MGYGEKIVSADSFRSGGVEVLFCFLCPGDSHIELSILAAISSLIQVARKGVLGVFMVIFSRWNLFFLMTLVNARRYRCSILKNFQ